MRALVCFAAVLCACGNTDPLTLTEPEVTHSEVVDGGTTYETSVPTSTPLHECTLDVENPFGGTAYGWRRELFDDDGRPRQKTTANNGLPVTQLTYEYDNDGRIISLPPYSFSYEADVMKAWNSGAVLSTYRLDAKGRPVELLANDALSTVLATFDWDAGDRLVGWQQSGQVQGFQYDGDGFLTREWVTSPSWSCVRNWVWTHGADETVSIHDESGHVSQTCDYRFDSKNRLTSARCSYSDAAWTYGKSTSTMALSQSASLTNLEKFSGECETELSRTRLPHAFEPLMNDPRPSKYVSRRLAATQIPMPQRECTLGVPFGGGGEGVK